jgi:antitoxin component YwqK of YwqJK toxin-antitoxin module
MLLNYYNNGDISEKLEWKNDKKTGIWEQYFPGNTLKLKANFIDNKLDGDFVVYTADGNLYSTGKYLNDQREGKWTFYNKDGTIQQELNYHAGKAAEEEELNKEQQEFFRSIDEAQGKYSEPDETDFLVPQAK